MPDAIRAITVLELLEQLQGEDPDLSVTVSVPACEGEGPEDETGLVTELEFDRENKQVILKVDFA